MKIDWKTVEDDLIAALTRCCNEFGSKHAADAIYGFCLDCNAGYLELIGHFNSEAKLREQALASQKQFPDLYSGWSIERLEESLRWEVGDWGYFEVFNASEGDSECAKALGACQNSGEAEQYRDSFLEMACRVAIRLERENAFKPINTTPNFRVLCVDHDESVKDGELRLEHIREGFKSF